MPSTATTRGRTRSTRPTSRSAPSCSSAAVSSSARAVARRTRLEMPIPRATRAARTSSVIGSETSTGSDRMPARCRAGQKRLPGLPKWVWVAAVRRPGVDPGEEQARAGSEEVGHLGVAERLELRPGEPHGASLAPHSGCGGRWPGLPSEDGRRHPPRHPGRRRAQRRRRADAPPPAALAGRHQLVRRRRVPVAAPPPRPPVEQPAGRPIEEIARSIRRLGGSSTAATPAARG